jgi:trigger factor
MDMETYLKTREMTREEFIEKEARQVAETGLKRRLVLDYFASVEGIQISDEEVQMIYNMSQNQARQDPSLKALAKGKTSKKDVGESLARRTINEIFNQRMVNRLREIATGQADKPAETVEAEPVIEAAAEAPVESVAETAEAPLAEAPVNEENAGETPKAVE